jgi:hypothetical protein
LADFSVSPDFGLFQQYPPEADTMVALSGIEPQTHSMRFSEVRFQTSHYATFEAHIENIGGGYAMTDEDKVV